MPLKITIGNDELYNYIRVNKADDEATVELLLKRATEEAEGHLNTDFSVTVIDDLGNASIVPVEAPATVKEWVFNRVAELYDNRGRRTKADFEDLEPFRVLPFRG